MGATGRTNEIATPAPSRTAGDATLHASRDASLADSKGLKDDHHFVQNSPGDQASRIAAQHVVDHQIDGKNPLQLVDSTKDQTAVQPVHDDKSGDKGESGGKSDHPSDNSGGQKDDKSGDHKDDKSAHAAEGGANKTKHGSGGSGESSSASAEEDPASALARQHRLELTQGLGLSPDASQSEIEQARHALKLGLAPTASQAEIAQQT